MKPKAKNKKPSICPLHIYNSWVMGFFGWDESDFNKFCYKHWQTSMPPKTSCGDTIMLTNDSGQTVVLIRMPKKEMTPEWLGLFQHEVIHAAFYVLSEAGQKQINTSDSNEFVTYLAQLICVNLLKET